MKGLEMDKGGSKKMKTKVLELPKKIKKVLKDIWKVGKDDPRRVKLSLKIGVSLTLVSLLYLMEPLFKGIGNSAIWAVMTVVVVLEFSAGATLCKGLNRGLGTLIAGSLAFFIEFVANDSGKIFRAIFIGAAVFIIGALITYLRFVPYIKKNYDYGMLIFLLTFNLITVSSYRVDTVIKIAHERFYTIAMGVGICLCMSLLFFPIWSGEDLHKTTVAKLQGLSCSIEACVNEYFEEEEKDAETSDLSEDTIYNGYKAVLDSKSTDEALAMYASWEPRHTRHCDRFPGKHYVKVGSVLRQFGYTVVALHGCLKTEIQTPRSLQRSLRKTSRRNLQERRSTAASSERKILRQQLSKIVVMTSLEFSEALPFAAFASLLVEMVARLDNVIEEVEELGTIACFKEYDSNVDRTDVEVRVEKPGNLVVGVE
ncbi:Aluminum-activated malate transporter 14 [Cardamine amara subsp. amara]|uniref:Aluminum-activated malate transporter 14 n=1 Tax=Cardamine amara subsp. amara TaxID=228776 RepID=A0ABD1BKL8_CARAN